VAATTRLIPALGLLAALGAPGISAEPRAGGRALSILAALEATDTALVGRVLDVTTHAPGTWADVLVIETLRGPALPERIGIRAGPEALLGGAAPLTAGATALWLVTRSGEGFELPVRLRQARVPLDGTPEREEARAFVHAYLAAVSAEAGPGALDAWLRRSVALSNPQLRRGVLEDLSHRLGAEDAPFLTRLAEASETPTDVRVFAVAGLGGLPLPLPASFAALLRATEPVAIRQAVVNAYAARGEWEALESGLGDPDERVRRTAVENLARPESVAALEGHFAREPSRPVQLAIVRQLGLIGTDASRSALRRILTSTPDAALHDAGEPWLETGP